MMRSGDREVQRATELPTYYYRDNFLSLLLTVARQYGDLLSKEERRFVDCWQQLGFDAQCLYVRLVSRVGPWFRESRLEYAELDRIDRAIDELLQSGLCVEATELQAPELDRLYTLAELRKVFDCGPSGVRKAGLLQAIAGMQLSGTELLAGLRGIDDARVIAPAATDTVAILQLLFFGNRRQGMTDFVLSDLGVARYYPYTLDRSGRRFPHRDALDEYLALANLADQVRDIVDVGEEDALFDAARELLSISPQYPASRERWSRLCNRVARHLERWGGDEIAISLYRRSAAHPARERRARLLEKAGDITAALDVCEDILTRPWCEDERDAALRIRPRLLRKLGADKVVRRRDKFAETTLALAPGEESVERAVARYLSSDWAGVYFVENSLMNALFGLAFWEQIFMPVPGAFNNPFQSVPADMYDSRFVELRRAAIDARLAELETLSLAEELPAAWRRFHGYQCNWVNWRVLDEQLIEDASTIVPAGHLVAIWRRILFDPRENRSGFPDLLALGERPGDYRMIEVKAPGDALQQSQRRWLRYFSEQGIPAQIAWVSWRDD